MMMTLMIIMTTMKAAIDSLQYSALNFSPILSDFQAIQQWELAEAFSPPNRTWQNKMWIAPYKMGGGGEEGKGEIRFK